MPPSTRNTQLGEKQNARFLAPPHQARLKKKKKKKGTKRSANMRTIRLRRKKKHMAHMKNQQKDATEGKPRDHLKTQ